MAEVCTGAAHNDHPKEEAETPGDVVAGLDELDYDEFPEQSPGRGHSPAQGLDAEEGEVLSDEEEGEVLSDEEEGISCSPGLNWFVDSLCRRGCSCHYCYASTRLQQASQ